MKSKTPLSLAISVVLLKLPKYVEAFSPLGISLGRTSVSSRFTINSQLSNFPDPATNPGQLQTPTETDVWKVYIAWCRQFSKSPDERRFQVFFNHYLQMESYARGKNIPLQLTEYADMTFQEYEDMLSNARTQDSFISYAKPSSTKNAVLEQKTSNSFVDGILNYVDHLEEISSKMNPLETPAEKIRNIFQSRLEEYEQNREEREKVYREKVAIREEERNKRHAEQEKALAKQLADVEAAAIATAKFEAEKAAIREQAYKKLQEQQERALAMQRTDAESAAIAQVKLERERAAMRQKELKMRQDEQRNVLRQQSYAKTTDIANADVVSNVDQDTPKESEVWNVYVDWCKHFSKLQDENRFRIFYHHYLQMESYAREKDIPLQLTKHADMTLEELMSKA